MLTVARTPSASVKSKRVVNRPVDTVPKSEWSSQRAAASRYQREVMLVAAPAYTALLLRVAFTASAVE
ncbi:hypothetical protein D3C72_1433090 [compost metagenome]